MTRIRTHGHRRAGPERCEHETVGRWLLVPAAWYHRLVGDQPVRAGEDLPSMTVSMAGVDDTACTDRGMGFGPTHGLHSKGKLNLFYCEQHLTSFRSYRTSVGFFEAAEHIGISTLEFESKIRSAKACSH